MAIKYDSGKLRFDLIPASSERAIAEVFTYGAAKYGENNWQSLDRATERYYAAIRRHLNAYSGGEWADSESGLAHLAHAITSLIMLYEHCLKHNSKENP